MSNIQYFTEQLKTTSPATLELINDMIKRRIDSGNYSADELTNITNSLLTKVGKKQLYAMINRLPHLDEKIGRVEIVSLWEDEVDNITGTNNFKLEYLETGSTNIPRFKEIQEG